jgi:hypothetical protein
VLPTHKYLVPGAKPILLVVESTEQGERHLHGLGVFDVVRGSRLLPLRHLRSFRSVHTFCDGLLVDADRADPVAETLFAYLRSVSHRWHGVEFGSRRADSALAEILDRVAGRFGMPWCEDRTSLRAIIRPSEVNEETPAVMLSRNQRKKLRKSRTSLAKIGSVEFRLVRCGSEHERCAQQFLELEQAGWKGDEQTAMACDAAQELFFHEMIGGFARSQRALFAELSLDGRVIASTSNLISGNAAFAFKVGWHRDFSRQSPGTQNEFETLMQSGQELTDLEYLDSCASPGSYIEKIWPWRQRYTSGLFPTSRLGLAACSTLRRLRKLKRRLQRKSS